MAINMEEDYFLTKFFDHLLVIFHKSDKRRTEAEKNVILLEQLLQPWNLSGIKGNSETCQAEQGAKAQDIEAESPSEEVAALSIADKALAQVQRIREKQAKVLSRETSNEEKTCDTSKDYKPKSAATSGHCHLKSDILEQTSAGKSNTDPYLFKNPNPQSVPKTLTENKQKVSKLSKTEITSGRAVSRDSSNPVPNSAHKLQKYRGSSPIVSACKERIMESEHIGVISRSTLNRVLKTSQAGGGKTKTGYRPAHLSAPFKTEIRPVRSKTRQNVAAKNGRPVSASKSVPQEHNVSKPSSLQQISTKNVDNSNTEDNSHEKCSEKKNLSCEEGSKVTWVAESYNDQEDLGTNDGDLSYKGKDGDEELHESKENVTSHDASLEAFNILKDGHSLEVPARLRKSISKNRKLNQKLQIAAVKFQACTTSSSQTAFLNKLTEHYDDEHVARSHDKSVIQFTALYKLLNKTIKQHLYIDYQDRTWRETVHSKRTIENICLLYGDMEEEYMEILKAQPLSVLHKKPLPSLGNESSIDWLSNSLPSLSVNNTYLDRVRYRKSKEVEELVDLNHQKRLLHQKLFIMDLAQGVLLPVLRSLHVSHRCFQLFYRATYSLLCDNGTRFPITIGEA